MDDDRIENVIDMSAARPARSQTWQARLQRNKEGGVLPTVSNALVLFSNDPGLTGLLSFNAFTSQHLITCAPPPADDGSTLLPGPYPRAWEAEDVALIQAYLQRVWSPKFARATVEDAMLAAAASNRFHPVCDWLDSLCWDRKPRLDLWLTNAFDCENNAYHRAVAAKFLIGAVKRVRHPGAKFDYMLVLEGIQGIGKSRSVETLFNPGWFSDCIPPDLNSKDAALALLGVWCLEFAEIEHLIRSEVEVIKAFLSRSVDRYRPPYGKAYVDRPRQCVLVGTTNSDDYLRDSTGNRRIWPVRCKTASVDWIEVNRDQLWAEAATREASGESTWLRDEDVAKAAISAQADRLSEDMWESTISAWIVGRVEVRISHVLTDALGVPKERLSKSQEMRVAAVLRRRGWTKGQKWQSDGPVKTWFAPSHAPPDYGPDETGQDDLLGA